MAKATKAGQCGWAALRAGALLAGFAWLAPGPATAAPPAADHSCLEQPASAAARQGLVAAVARVAPAVVNIAVLRERGEPFEELDDMEFFLSSAAGLPLPGGAVPERAVSSGFLIAADGEVLTSAHAVRGAQETWVRTVDGARYRARVLGIDRRTDVALLKVEASGLPVVPLAAGTRLCPGEWVGAIGAPFGFEHSVTAGVVSAYPRYVPGTGGLPLIQTDAAINPGSSGGPLFNAAGVVVGMNSMIFSALGGSVGLSFALPIDRVMRIASALRTGGAAARASIGMRTQLVTPELANAFGLDRVRGALVVRVDPDGPAAAAGVRAGDIVLSVNAGPAASQPEIEEAIASARTDAPVALELWRRKAARRAIVVLERIGGRLGAAGGHRTGRPDHGSERRRGRQRGRLRRGARGREDKPCHRRARVARRRGRLCARRSPGRTGRPHREKKLTCIKVFRGRAPKVNEPSRQRPTPPVRLGCESGPRVPSVRPPC
ncbi:MAG: trypsin [Ramlibacter sp.]|nr:trypsin [Ramlibacter sp.]